MAVIIGGTIITDAAVLMILAAIANIQERELSPAFFVQLFGLLAAMVFVILWGVPRLGRWFFRNLLGRRQTVSHHATMERVPASLSRFFKETSVIMLYPSQP